MKKTAVLVFISILLFASCGNENGSNRSGLRTDSGHSHALISCNCPEDSLPVNDSLYAGLLLVSPNDSGYVNIRKDHSSFQNSFRGNILCQVPCGTKLRGYGPMKDITAGAGFFYSVLITDETGRKCRGYIAYGLLQKLP